MLTFIIRVGVGCFQLMPETKPSHHLYLVGELEIKRILYASIIGVYFDEASKSTYHVNAYCRIAQHFRLPIATKDSYTHEKDVNFNYYSNLSHKLLISLL